MVHHNVYKLPLRLISDAFDQYNALIIEDRIKGKNILNNKISNVKSYVLKKVKLDLTFNLVNNHRMTFLFELSLKIATDLGGQSYFSKPSIRFKTSAFDYPGLTIIPKGYFRFLNWCFSRYPSFSS